MSLECYAKHLKNRMLEYEEQRTHIEAPKKVEQDPVQSTPFFTVVDMMKDVLPTCYANGFYAISLIGGQGSGKTTTAAQFAAIAIQEGFRIVYAQPEDFLDDVKGWRDRVLSDESNASSKTCIIIDDLSYANDTQGRKNQALLKNTVAKFRHIFSGKIFCLFITHRLHAAPPIFRNSKSWIFSDMQAADRDDALEVIGKSKQLKDTLEELYAFISRVTIEGARDKIVKYMHQNKICNFTWGTKEDPGDGRLMACFHMGKLRVFRNVLTYDLNFEDYRYPALTVIN